MMPVNTLSATLSTSVYVVSLLLLLGVLIYPARAIFDSSSQRSAEAIAQGLALELDSLSPGMSSHLYVGQAPATVISVHLGGEMITVRVDGASSTAKVLWMLPNADIEAGKQYTASLLGGTVVLA